jgi:hypothetical protein
MGQLIDFYAGDPDVIGAAFSANDFEKLSDRSRIPFHADLSLHLTPDDSDALTAEAQKIVGSGPTSMLDSFVRNVGGDERECSADLLGDDWVRMMAAVPEGPSRGLVGSAWYPAGKG